MTDHGITFKKSSTKIELINKVVDLRIQLQRQANETTAMENDGPAETADETIAVTHLDEPICDFAFSPVFNQVFHKPSETKQKSVYKKPTHSVKSRMIPCVLYFFDERYKKNHYHVTHCFSSCAVFAFLRCIYDSLYYGVFALSNIPSKCSECCRVPSLCYSGSALHFPFNNYSAIFPFGCTGECSRCMFLACMRIFRQHDSERRQKQFPKLINKLEESDTEET